MDNIWKKCSSCKTPIKFGQTYWVCNVSTCNARATSFAFCQISCWDAHLPVMNHRESWALEKKAPASAQSAESPSPVVSPLPKKAPSSGGSMSQPDLNNEVLVVASKLKAYIKAKSGMNTSQDVLAMVSDYIRNQADDAIVRARNAGRKTVMARDFSK